MKMQFNPNSRKYIQHEVKVKLEKKVAKLQIKYGLTDLEVARILSSIEGHILYWAMRRDIEEKGLNGAA